jgi:hypothetical protein
MAMNENPGAARVPRTAGRRTDAQSCDWPLRWTHCDDVDFYQGEVITDNGPGDGGAPRTYFELKYRDGIAFQGARCPNTP